MRVLQVIDRLAAQGGAERLQRTLASCHRGSNVELLIATLDQNDDSWQSAIEGYGARVFPLPARKTYNPLRFLRLLRLVRSQNVDLIHTHLIRSTLLGGLAGRLTATPVVTTLHNPQPDADVHPLLLRAESYVLAHVASAIVAVGWETARAHRGRVGSRPIEVIPNAVPSNARAETARRRTRASLGVGDETHLLVAVGRLAEQKGYLALLEATAKLRTSHANVELAIAGDGAERERLVAWIASLGLEGVVHLLGRRDDVPEILAAGDIFVSSALWEGLPVSILEAMVAGLPVVATAVGDVPQIVDGNSGIVVPAREPAVLARVVASLIDDPERARSLGAAGRRRAIDEFGTVTWFERHRALYTRLSLRVEGEQDRC